MKQKSIDPILHLCARSRMRTELRQQLSVACQDVSGWDDLLQVAEYHGLAPLLHEHLSTVAIDMELPKDVIRGLKFLSIRHQLASTVLKRSLQMILSLMESEGIRCLVLKGAALSHTVYPEISLRPMRDIDLLLAKKDVYRAYDLLKKENYSESDELLPEGYHHLPPLFKDVDGLKVCIELHHGLFPDDPPYYQQLDFEELYNNRQEFEVDGVRANTLADEEMLWHLYQHGFHAPLTYEPFRLIAVADIVSIVEARLDDIDWGKVKTLYPQLHNALALFHHITPWNKDVLTSNIFEVQKDPSGVGECYNGWPRTGSKRNRDTAGQGTWDYLYETLYPSKWWSMLYYGHSGSLIDSLRCRLVAHPVHVLRWVKVKLSRGMRKNVLACKAVLPLN